MERDEEPNFIPAKKFEGEKKGWDMHVSDILAADKYTRLFLFLRKRRTWVRICSSLAGRKRLNTDFHKPIQGITKTSIRIGLAIRLKILSDNKQLQGRAMQIPFRVIAYLALSSIWVGT